MVQRLRIRTVFIGSGLLAAIIGGGCGHSAPDSPAGAAGTGSPPVTGAGSGNPGSSGSPGAGGSGAGPVTGAGAAGRMELPIGGDTAIGGSSATPGGSAGAMDEPTCTANALPADPMTRPGYTEERSPEVASLLQRMSIEAKVQQLFGIPDPPTPRPGSVWSDIQRSDDADAGAGKTVRGYRYRDAGRGLNLAAPQHDRPSAGKDYSTVFPAQSVRSSSWDLELEYRVGVALGDETVASKNTMMLAPCMNIIRHPRWGRTQETYSEDMFHTGRMASALTAGIQQHVVACPKHYAANNIEFNRHNQNAEMTEQTLREIYGRHFEMVVQEGGAGCIMAAYNKVNGTKSTQNKHLLREMLKGPVASGGMGFRGLVLSDWWAMPGREPGPAADVALAQSQALEAIEAGLDVEVPWGMNYSQLVALSASGRVSPALIDEAVARVLEQKFRFNNTYTDSPYGKGTIKTKLVGDSIENNEEHLALSEEAAVKSSVLLKNGPPGMPVLPFKDPIKSIAVVGPDVTVTVNGQTSPPITGTTMRMALDPNTGDRGSSRVNHDPDKAVGPFDGIKAAAEPKGITVTSGNSPAMAADADAIVVVVGLTAGDEGEEYSIASLDDRKSLDLTQNQNAFVTSVLDLNKPTVVIVQSGSIVNLPWLEHANQKQATVWVGYPGQRGGAAMGKLLMGDANFSGKMAMAWPKREEDMPPFTSGTETTNMGYFFGYRWFDDLKRKGQEKELHFPFGHGLSYTTFAYSNMNVPCGEVARDAIVPVTVQVQNTGPVEGEEVVMVFVAPPPKPEGITGERPVKELKGFRKVKLNAMGQEGSGLQITIPLRMQDLRRWEGGANGSWVIDPGTYTVMVGPNADELTLTDTFTVK